MLHCGLISAVVVWSQFALAVHSNYGFRYCAGHSDVFFTTGTTKGLIQSTIYGFVIVIAFTLY
jgi:hypothetical protein